MKVVIGNQWYSTIEGDSVQITRSASDPVPTCTLHLRDNASTLNPQCMQEILVIDDQKISNPTVNNALDPALLNIASNWNPMSGVTGMTITQAGGAGGAIITINNVAVSLYPEILQQQQLVTQGQTYTLSCYMQGSGSPTNVAGYLTIFWTDFSGTGIGSGPTFTTATPISTTLTRISVTGTVPAGAFIANIEIGINVTSATNSGTVTITQVQLEPNWFSSLNYPTPWCGPQQTNCVMLPLGYWIRQYRKFAGFVNHVVAQDYHGNVRTLQVDSVGYAWLMGTILVNNSYTNESDSAILANLLTNVTSDGVAMLATSMVTGVTISNLQANWDSLRDLFDGVCGVSGFYWTVDYYWTFVYAPPGFFSMGIGLICDNSSQPNFSTTYPAYNFSAEQDFTQPGSTILVIGSGTNVAKVIDPSQTAQIGALSGYFLPSGSSWMRKVNDSTLASVADCTTRGIAEILQYDFTRSIYHLSTNVELIPGESVQLTSATEGLNSSTQLIQQVTATWIGTNETLTDEWEYVADLGATNRTATNMMSRIFRITQKGSSAPAISSTTLVTIERIGIADSTGTGTTFTGYAPTILADTPIAYYRLGEITGTIADDISGNAYQGTLNGGITEGIASLIHIDTSMTFDGSTGYISLPTTFVPTGSHAWSLECWVEIAAFPANGTYTMVAMGNNATGQAARLQMKVEGGSFAEFICSTVNGDITNGFSSPNPGFIYHVVGTYDGANTRLYVNGQLAAGPTPFTLNLVASYASIAADGTVATDFFPGTLDEVGIYGYALSSTQVYDHYTAGISLSNYPQIVLADTPVAYYRLRETSGTTASDSSGNGLSGTLHGTITEGTTSLLRVDTAMTFDGSTGYIQLPSSGSWPTGNSAWSLECWCKPTNSTNSANGHLLTLGNPGTNGAVAAICQTSTGGWGIVTWGGTGHDFQGNGTSAAGTIYYIAATYDGASNLLLYVGVGGTVTTHGPFNPGTLTLTTSTHQTIGDAWNGSAQAVFFHGVIDEAAIYDYKLSATQIATHYAEGTS